MNTEGIIDSLTGLFGAVGFFAAVVLTLYFYFRSRNKERMAMIDKGIEFPVKKTSSPAKAIKTGVFLIGIALGIFFGHIIGKYTVIDEVVAFFVMILLFGGIALTLNYIIEQKLKKRDE